MDEATPGNATAIVVVVVVDVDVGGVFFPLALPSKEGFHWLFPCQSGHSTPKASFFKQIKADTCNKRWKDYSFLFYFFLQEDRQRWSATT